MAKVTVCDICKHDGKLTQSTRYFRVTGKRHLRLDYCDGCKSQIPKGMKEYEEFVAKVKGIRIAGNATTCKYCGGLSGSLDPDVLCKDCRETFGHSFYSEL